MRATYLLRAAVNQSSRGVQAASRARRRRVLKRVDGPLGETVPAGRQITVEDLLTFRPGYRFITVEPTTLNPPYPVIQRAEELQLAMAQPDPRTPYGPDEWMARFATLPLMYQPGERWQYNAGSLVLGVLVARAAGQPLDVFLHDRLFEPLSMRNTGFVMRIERLSRPLGLAGVGRYIWLAHRPRRQRST